MVGEEGFLKLLKSLDDRFGKDQGRDKYDKLQDFFEIKGKLRKYEEFCGKVWYGGKRM